MLTERSKLSRLWKELKRRRVIQVIIVYATVAYIIFELVDIVEEPLLLPEWALPLVIVFLVIGFPFAIIFSWIYDISLKGITKTEKMMPSAGMTNFDNSIAVLPFLDMSPDKDQEYFCDGMTEEIINALTHIESLKVIARTSAFAFKNTNVDMRKIGQKLNVEKLLEGSIRKDKNRLRITAQLINVSDGSHIWSERYDREMTDVFAIQDDISLAIADILKIKLLGEEKTGVLKHHTEHLEAYNLYMKGNHSWQKMTCEGFKKARKNFENALLVDPEYALAYVGLAAVQVSSAYWGNVAPKDAFPLAIDYLNKALEIDNTLAEAHCYLGVCNLDYYWNWKKAEPNFQQALQLNPNSALIHIQYSFLLSSTGRHKEAITEAKRAQELDPLSSYINTYAGRAYYSDSQFDKAIEVLKMVNSHNPGYYLAHSSLAFAYVEKSKPLKALLELKLAYELSNGIPLMASLLAVANYYLNKKKKSEKLLDSLNKRSISEYIPATSFYMIHKARGENDLAFEWLERACKERDSFLYWLRIAPSDSKLPGMFNDPREKALLKSAGL
jgi:TolB-like protein/Tfp pilus assembly protein PilF